MRPLHLISLLVSTCLLAGCPAPEADPNVQRALGRCTYVNGFSDQGECKEYLGSEWTDVAMSDNCSAPVPGSDPGLLEFDVSCERESILGECFVDEGTVEASTIVFPASPGNDCSSVAVGCSFAGGEFVPAAACGGTDPIPPLDMVPFVPPRKVCVDPIEGELPGDGPNGQICTWEAISASTEAGRHYADYASCEPVMTQRPYFGLAISSGTAEDDPRHTDPEWQSEYGWVNSQVEASACVCCHMAQHSPADGPSGWHIGMEGIWTDALSAAGLAMMAGWVDSTAFGAFDPEDNNGFSRELTGMPTTEPQRMRAFFEGELERLGLTQEDFVDTPPFGGPLADQLDFQPNECRDGNGIDAAGVMTWTGGAARYVYVLEPDTDAPGVPPNLDLPDGTVWRLDVAPDSDPVRSGLLYGDVPPGTSQAFPEQTSATELVSGREYYLYVLFDVYQPLQRCLFVAG
jgi:hypothetical protein